MWLGLWLGWLAIFGIIEGIAITNTVKGDTLSEQVWQYLTQPRKRRGGKDPAPWVWVGRVGVAGLLGWLAFHFFTGV